MSGAKGGLSRLAAALVLGAGLFCALPDLHAQGTEAARPRAAPPEARKLKNPQRSDAASLSLGKALYDEHCRRCHGKDGRGGEAGAGPLSQPAGDLANAKVMGGRVDGELFWIISKGGHLRAGSGKRPRLSDDDGWHIVNYLRLLAGRGG